MPGNSRFLLCVLIQFVVLVSFGQSERKFMNAKRLPSPPKIDGLLNDSCWQYSAQISDFTQYVPNTGNPPTKPSTIFLGYDDEGLYVGGIFYDIKDSIMRELSRRDEVNDVGTDVLGIHINPFDDGNYSFYFVLSASGVQADRRFISNTNEVNWDAVWISDVCISDSGWTAEVMIPFSALRFPNDSVQHWGFNLWRKINRHFEWDCWSPVDPEKGSWYRQSGVLDSIIGIKPPPRLSLTPYTSGYYIIDTNRKGSALFHAGMDLKYGISNAFTLDMTMIPDFGQVKFDDRVLNLTPYEIQYNERRQFFTEGVELFNKANLFYSRRIGGKPSRYASVSDSLNEHEVIRDNPQETRLINATKISGRTDRGLGIGFLNAMTARTYATVLDTNNQKEREIITQGFTNYNVVVFDQNLSNRSSISFINTNMVRGKHLENVSGINFELRSKSNEFGIDGYGAISYRKRFDQKTTGFKYKIRLGKINGRWRYSYTNSTISNTYDQNQLGYLKNNNEIKHKLLLAYNVQKPFWVFRNMLNELNFNYHTLYSPRQYTYTDFTYIFSAYFRNMYQLFMNAVLVPESGRDYYEARTPGRFFRTYKSHHYSFTLGSDYYGNRLYYAVHGGLTKSYDYFLDTKQYEYSLELSWRVNDHARISLSHEHQFEENQPGYVTTEESNEDIIFGARDRSTIINTLTASYIFNKSLSLTSNIRHYVSMVSYDSFFVLNPDGSLQPTGYYKNHDMDFNLFNLDLVFKWDFAPGSEMQLVWKNEILSFADKLTPGYWDDFTNTLNSPQTNSFSFKLLYYIDYRMIKGILQK